MATILNQATLTYTYGDTTAQTLSNIASTERQASLTLTKRVLEAGYRAGGELTFLLSLANCGLSTLQNVAITDDLAAYTPAGMQTPVVPLTYTGPAELYLNGVFSETLTPVPSDEGVTFTIPALPAGANALLLYKARVNGFAPLAVGSTITNTVSLAAPDALTASAEVPVDSYALVTVEKEMRPDPITDGSTLSVVFTIENSGNTEATALELTDDLPLPLTDVTVTVNGVETTDFTFENNRLTLPGQGGTALTVPAATFAQSAETGAVSIAPGVTAVVLTGTV